AVEQEVRDGLEGGGVEDLDAAVKGEHEAGRGSGDLGGRGCRRSRRRTGVGHRCAGRGAGVRAGGEDGEREGEGKRGERSRPATDGQGSGHVRGGPAPRRGEARSFRGDGRTEVSARG